jgi:hypothetical protein
MNSNTLYETLKKLIEIKGKVPSYIYLDEQNNKIKEIPLSKDMAASTSMKQYKNPAKEIHNFMFGY